MARPKVFVSSTYYDLKHIRNSLNVFIEGLGYEPVLYEQGDIPFHHDAPLDISCYEEIESCHILVLIIGGRYGSSTSDTELVAGTELYNSITKKEYETARKKDIPIYIFIEKNVHSEYHTYKKNRHNSSVSYAHVDNVNIFKLVDDIYAQKRNNLIHDFEHFDDISTWLRDQWAGLFADFLSGTKRDNDLEELSVQVAGLKDLSSVLKGYSELIMTKLELANVDEIVKTSNKMLRKSAMFAFRRNDLIKHLRDVVSGTGAESELYEHFLKSDSLHEFLLRLPNVPMLSGLADNEHALRDFETLKRDIADFE